MTITDLTLAQAPPAALARLDDLGRTYDDASRATATKRAYQTDWQMWCAWCADHHVEALPASPATVADYLADQAGQLKVATLQRRLSAISQAHQLAGHPSPTKHELVRTRLKGIRRIHGAEQRQVAAATTEPLRLMLDALPRTLAGARDRALLLVGFGAALRRSELAALEVADLNFSSAGVVVRIRRSKTDQAGEGAEVAIPVGRPETCAVKALRAWLKASGTTAGPLFRPLTRGGAVRDRALSDRSVAEIVKAAAARAGLDPAEFSGHSLRAGLATAAAAAGAGDASIAKQGRWKSQRVMSRYTQRGRLFENNAAGKVL